MEYTQVVSDPHDDQEADRQDKNLRRWQKKSSSFVSAQNNLCAGYIALSCFAWILIFFASMHYYTHREYRTFSLDIMVAILTMIFIMLPISVFLYMSKKQDSIRVWSDKKYVSILAHNIIHARKFDSIVAVYTKYCGPVANKQTLQNISILFDTGVLKDFRSHQQFLELLEKIVNVDSQLKYLVASCGIESLTNPPETLVQTHYMRLLAKSEELTATYNRDYYPIIVSFLPQPDIFEGATEII